MLVHESSSTHCTAAGSVVKGTNQRDVGSGFPVFWLPEVKFPVLCPALVSEVALLGCRPKLHHTVARSSMKDTARCILNLLVIVCVYVVRERNIVTAQALRPEDHSGASFLLSPLHGFQGSNLGPQACMANLPPSEPSCQPCIFKANKYLMQELMKILLLSKLCFNECRHPVFQPVNTETLLLVTCNGEQLVWTGSKILCRNFILLQGNRLDLSYKISSFLFCFFKRFYFFYFKNFII